MAGRPGRRRLDTEGHVITWNIANASTAGVSTLPRIVFPEYGLSKGSLIKDITATAVAIDLNRYHNISNIASLQNALDVLGDGDEEDDEEVKVSLKATSVDEKAMFASISACVIPLIEDLGFTSATISGIIDRVQRIILGAIKDEMRTDVYLWSERISLINAALAEIYTTMHRSSNLEFLLFVRKCHSILHRCSIRLLHL